MAMIFGNQHHGYRKPGAVLLHKCIAHNLISIPLDQWKIRNGCPNLMNPRKMTATGLRGHSLETKTPDWFNWANISRLWFVSPSHRNAKDGFGQ